MPNFNLNVDPRIWPNKFLVINSQDSLEKKSGFSVPLSIQPVGLDEIGE